MRGKNVCGEASTNHWKYGAVIPQIDSVFAGWRVCIFFFKEKMFLNYLELNWCEICFVFFEVLSCHGSCVGPMIPLVPRWTVIEKGRRSIARNHGLLYGGCGDMAGVLIRWTESGRKQPVRPNGYVVNKRCGKSRGNEYCSRTTWPLPSQPCKRPPHCIHTGLWPPSHAEEETKEDNIFHCPWQNDK
jgi:hypothetical protein